MTRLPGGQYSVYKYLFWTWIVVTGLLACNPSVGNDATAVRLAAPELWLESGHIWGHPAFSMLQVQEMLSMCLLTVCGDPGSTLQYAFYVMVAVMLWGMPCYPDFASLGIRARRVGKTMLLRWRQEYVFNELKSRRAAGALAAALWLTCPMAYFCAQQHLADTILTGFMVGSVYCLISKRNACAGFLAGIAAGVKPIGLAGVLLVVILSADCEKGSRVRNVLRALIPCILALSPWYLANYLVHGHVLFPWVGQVSEISGQLAMTDISFLDRFIYTSMPWEAGLDHAGRLGPWVLVMAPFILWLPWRERWARCLGLYVVGMWAFWWVLGLWHERYMLSTVAVHYAACSMGLCRVLNLRRRRMEREKPSDNPDLDWTYMPRILYNFYSKVPMHLRGALGIPDGVPEPSDARDADSPPTE